MRTQKMNAGQNADADTVAALVSSNWSGQTVALAFYAGLVRIRNPGN